MKKYTRLLIIALGAICLLTIMVEGGLRFFDLNNAVVKKDHSRLVFLLKMGADPNKRTFGAYTPLHFAVGGGDQTIVDGLIKAGANINAVDQFGSSPISLAVSFGKKEILQLLIKDGAKTEPYLLYSASSSGRPEIVEVLLKAGLNPNFIFPEGNTALQAEPVWRWL